MVSYQYCSHTLKDAGHYLRLSDSSHRDIFFLSNVCLVTSSQQGNLIMKVIPNSLPVLSTEQVVVLRKLAVDREIQFSTEQYGCLQKSNMILTPLQR